MATGYLLATMTDWLTPQIILTILGQLLACAALWGAVRADIASIHREQERQDKDLDKLDTRVTETHQRIDRIIERRTHPREH